MWPDSSWHGGCRGRGELLGPDGINGAQRLEAAEDQTWACGAAMVTARVVQARCIRTRMSAFTRIEGRMTDHIRLHDLGDPGAVVAQIKSRDRRRDLVPGRLGP